MLSEKEVCDRAEYCYLICLQLNWMLSNESIQPVKYLEQIRKSSLGLAEDDFIVMSLEEGLKTGLEDCGVNNLELIGHLSAKAGRCRNNRPAGCGFR